MDHPGKAIAEARTSAGLSQRELARRAGVSPTTLRGLEAGEISSHAHTIAKLERALEQARNPDHDEAAVAFRSGVEPDGLVEKLIHEHLTADVGATMWLREELVDQLRARELATRWPALGEPKADLIVDFGGQKMVVEVKTTGGRSEPIYEAMGVLLYHLELLGDDGEVGLIGIDRPPSEDEIARLTAREMMIAGSGSWDRLDIDRDDQ